jgi:hypothetical protein
MKKSALFYAISLLALMVVYSGSSYATPQVVINEVYYDSPGTDENTFTELKGPAGESLDSLYLIGVNGRNGDTYAMISLSGYSIPADSYFVVGQDTGVQNVDLIDSKANWQNGADNVILIQVSGADTSVLDAVGYGEFTDSDTFFVGEGDPALGVEAGHSIARGPDEKDTDNNRTDFFDFTTPSPGLCNPFSDVAVASIILPDTIYKDSTYAPCALIKNNGNTDESFKTACNIDAYTDTVELMLIAKRDSVVVFRDWVVPDTGYCMVTVSVLLEGDMDTTNDSITKPVMSTVGVEEKVGAIPTIFRLYQNRPNPSLDKTEILYQLPIKSRVTLTIYDLTGRIVRRLIDRIEGPGCKTIIWNGQDENGKEATSGIYIYKLQTHDYTAAKKMILLR